MRNPTPLLEALKTRVLLGDGAMGTQLQAAGIPAGGCGELWNLEQPDKIMAIQKLYADSGSQCIITNSFGGCSYTLKRHQLEDRAYDINKAAAEIARRAVGEDGYVLGDVGPFGGFLMPLGEVTEEQLNDILTEQIRGLLDGGADAILLETQTALEEASVGVAAARALDAPCVIASFAYDKAGDDYKTMMGIGPADVVARLDPLGVDVFGSNCGTGIDIHDHINIVKAYRAVTDKPIMAQPNAGQPEMREGEVVYLETPDKMAEQVQDLIDAGASIIGGCCGTSPEHIRCFHEHIKA